MSVSSVAVVLLTSVAWVATYRKTVHHPLDAMALILYLTAYHLLLRPMVLAFGFDSPFPNDVFLGRDNTALIVSTQALAILWIVALGFGCRLLRPLALLGAFVVPDRRGQQHSSPHCSSHRRQRSRRDGDPSPLVPLRRRRGLPASIQRRTRGGSRSLRLFPFIGTIVSVAAYLQVRHGRSSGSPGIARWKNLALTLAVLNSALSYSWGARGLSGFWGLVALLAGRVLFASTSERVGVRMHAWWRVGRRRRQLAVVALLVFGSAFGLRIYRDVLINDEVASSIEGQSVVRQLSVATNDTYYDALLLVVDEWPSTFSFRGFRDFRDAAATSIPAVFAANPHADPPSVVVARGLSSQIETTGGPSHHWGTGTSLPGWVAYCSADY